MSRLFFYLGNADIFCKHILRIFDCDGNDYLDFKEFLMAMDIARCDSGKTEENNTTWVLKGSVSRDFRPPCCHEPNQVPQKI